MGVIQHSLFSLAHSQLHCRLFIGTNAIHHPFGCHLLGQNPNHFKPAIIYCDLRIWMFWFSVTQGQTAAWALAHLCIPSQVQIKQEEVELGEGYADFMLM